MNRHLFVNQKHDCSRRQFHQAAAAASVAAAGFFIAPASTLASHRLRGQLLLEPPVRTITRGPRHHWFGYYDKREFDSTNRLVLSNQVTFEHRTPRPDDSIDVGYVDTGQQDRWVRLGSSRSWGWQQGCMLQWRPGFAHQVVWNDREGDRYVCRIKDIQTGATRTLPRPVYALDPQGKFAVTADFARIQRMRPGYGYVGLDDPVADQLAPETSGVWRMDLETGDSELIFSLADAARIQYKGQALTDKWNYFNHLLVSPDGTRMIVLHRWRADRDGQPAGGFTTRMFTLNLDGSEKYVLDPSGHTSHFIWRDEQHVCAWTRPEGKPSAFYLMTDQTNQLEVVGEGVMTQNGHNTYLPGTDQEWILNDTYPDRQQRKQRPYLFHVPSQRKIELGAFHSPEPYRGEWRCDTHPRASNDGRTVAIDSPHTQSGRQVHLIDVGEIVFG